MSTHNINIPKNVHIVTLIWGDEYIDFFVKNCLASLLENNNIPFFSQKISCIFKIHTNSHGKQILEQSHQIIELSKYCSIEYVIFDKEIKQFASRNTDSSSYEIMMLSHNVAIEEANQTNSAIVINYPDVIYSSSFFYNLFTLINDQKRLIFISAVKTVKEDVTREVEACRNAYQSISDDKLRKIALSNIHPIIQNTMDTGLIDINWTSLIITPLSKNEYFQRSFNPNVFYFWPIIKCPYNEKNTIDNSNYIFKIGIPIRKFFFADTRKMFFLECTSKNLGTHSSSSSLYKNSILQCLFWTFTQMHPKQISFLRKKNYFTLPQTKSRISMREVKDFFFTYTLLFLHKLGPTLIKPFLFRAYLRYLGPEIYQEKKSSFLFFYKYLIKYKILNHYENKLTNYIRCSYDINYVMEYFTENKSKISNYCCLRSFKFIQRSLYTSDQGMQWINFLSSNCKNIDLSYPVLTVFGKKQHSSLFEAASIDTKLLNILKLTNSEISSSLLTKSIDSIPFKKKYFKFLGKIFRSAVTWGNAKLIKVIYESPFYGHIPQKYKHISPKYEYALHFIQDEQALKEFSKFINQLYDKKNKDLLLSKCLNKKISSQLADLLKC